MRALCIGSDYANAADARGKQRAKREKEKGLMGRDCGTVEEELGKALKSLRGGEESFVKTPDAVCVCVLRFFHRAREIFQTNAGGLSSTGLPLESPCYSNYLAGW